ERVVLSTFILTAVLWMSRSLLNQWIPALDDTIIAMISAVLLFIIPASDKKRTILTWNEAVKLPWGILLLFGGGLALATGFQQSGLAEFIGSQLSLMQGASIILILIVVVVAVNFLTEITSNIATTAMILPILAPLALVIGVHPYVLMVGAALAASCAFMLPVATPPNAVVFGSGYLKISDMVKTGIWLNIISIILVVLVVYFLMPLVWGIEINAPLIK
ncbi:MAG: sodium-dependent dicarboxylate transporter 2/3/5, partial [Saprospiraceae bacterium]